MTSEGHQRRTRQRKSLKNPADIDHGERSMLLGSHIPQKMRATLNRPPTFICCNLCMLEKEGIVEVCGQLPLVCRTGPYVLRISDEIVTGSTVVTKYRTNCSQICQVEGTYQ